MNKNIAILMAVRNGQNYLPEQLQSFNDQTYKKWSLYISDDGSEDTTPDIINDFFSSNPDLSGFLTQGPCKGFCQNFQSLISNEKIQSTYYAFSDQDDIWLPDKLQRAVNFLNTVPENIPALYCSGTTLIDAKNNVIGESLRPCKPLSFANALLHNVASGNTMVFNHSARKLLIRACSDMMVVHDWSLYQIVCSCGGKAYFDMTSTVLYRQHNNNIIGDGNNIIQRIKHFPTTISHKRNDWNSRNKIVLNNVRDSLTENSKSIIKNYYNIRKGNVLQRLKYFYSSGVYHQYRLGTLSTFIYVLLNKM